MGGYMLKKTPTFDKNPPKNVKISAFLFIFTRKNQKNDQNTRDF